MEMTEVFDKLKTLQEVLSEKYELEALIADAPKRLSNQEELLERMKKQFIERNMEYEILRSKVALLKTQLADAEAKRERSEKGMDSITTHREYEALEKEIKDATELEQQLRKDLQKEEKLFVELDENIKQDEQLIAQQESELNQGKDNLAQEVESLKTKLENLKKQEEEIVPGIDPEIIFKFERIIKSKHSKGIVVVKGNVCDGCHMILPAQFANEVHTGEKIVFCPYCSRILYYEEDESGESEYFHLDDTGSLADLFDDFSDEEEEIEDDEYEEDDRRSSKDE
ncbi:MAG: nucleic acid-binding protein [Treponema sp.]|jgi:predicted  nucleic acid-binding Zn-ribbon protein|nr:nucleic acid-binding protein [Treponema sp.]